MGIKLLIKINNRNISNYDPSEAPVFKVDTENPTITWEFDLLTRAVVDGDGVVISQEEYGQNSYEIRISDENVRIGTDSFVGRIIQTGIIEGQNRFWVYNGPSLIRGKSYYGQIRITDEFNRNSDWKDFSFYYNSLPYINDVRISPFQPSPTDNLQLTYNFYDDDGDIENGTIIRWFKNGEYQKQYDDSVLIDFSYLQNEDRWMADVWPFDGYEYGVKVSSGEVIIKQTSIVTSNVTILPKNPNKNDILKINYVVNDELEQDNVSIRWYINNLLDSSFNNQQFIRPSVVENDTVRCEVKHNSETAYVSSSSITICSSKFIVKNIVIEGKVDPLDVSSVKPVIKWKSYIPTGKQVNYISVKIGTFYEDDSIYSDILIYDKDIFITPAGLLQRGRDYYISISISDTDVFEEYGSSHFRIRGSRWGESVDNSVGWTIESLFIVNDISTELNDYQVIRINDGNYFAELKLRSDGITLISGEVVKYSIDLTKTRILTITGKNNDIKIYIDRDLVINGDGKFTRQSDSKVIEFGCPTDGEFNISYKYFSYTVSGSFLPGQDSEYANMKFYTFMNFPDNEIIALKNYMDGKNIFGLNPDNHNENSSIYVIKAGDKYKSNTVSRTFSPINKINISNNKKKVVCAHSNGVTIINGYVINSFSKELIFVDSNGNNSDVLPNDDGWELVQNYGGGVVYFDDMGFNINTLITQSSIEDEYNSFGKGGIWYYTNNKFGTEWFDEVDNSKGWTVDFNLKVVDVQNNDSTLDDDNKAKGIGIYTNDGNRQEVINFLPQEIIFTNANEKIIYDTTGEVDYRLTGKKDNLKLFAKPDGSSKYSNIADVNFIKQSTNNGNGLKPSVFEDNEGNIHAVWHDDGNGIGKVYYSKYSNEKWSDPEIVVESNNGQQFADIIVDSDNNIYVSYEAKDDDGSLIALVYKNNIGWSTPYYTGVGNGYSKYPKLIFDSRSNPCLVWEDNRDSYSHIYINTFLREDLKWKGELKLSNNPYGSYSPSIASYMDEIFVSWTKKEQDNSSVIEVIKYNVLTGSLSSIVEISETGGKAEHSDILSSVSGKIFVVWHNNESGEYRIHAAVLSLSLAFIESKSIIVDGYGVSRYPVLSEHTTTGDVYIVWQDYKDDYSGINPVINPSVDIFSITQEPVNSNLYIAVYKNNSFLSSNKGSFDIIVKFNDDRNSYFPAVPSFFGGELLILYEAYSADEYGSVFLDNGKLLSQIKGAFYNLSREDTIFLVNYGPTEYGIDRDLLLNENYSTKEIRFGDFSNVLNSHYSFKNFKYYTKDAVDPIDIIDINSSEFPINTLSAYDAVINNYGDVWIVGTCGMKFYVDRQNRVISVGENEELPGFIDDNGDREPDESLLKTFKSITFDTYNNMYIGGSYGIRYSIKHIEGFSVLKSNSVAISDDVTTMVFDKANKLFVGTTTGLKIYNISYTEGIPEATLETIVSTNYPDSYITSLKIDDNNCIWIGTINGLYRFYKNNFLYFTVDNGLNSNIINDIAIRNTAIRYIATSSGIDKMVGFNFDSDKIWSDNDSIWNNNVKSILWKEPNIIIAGTLSKINQILVDDIDETYETLIYDPSASVVSRDDFQTYYIITNSDKIVNSKDIIEVYINGNFIPHGYDLGYDKITDPDNPKRIIRFKTVLKHNDVVEITIRNDLEKIATFDKTIGEKIDTGSSYVRIRDFAVNSTDSTSIKVYAAVEGDENEVKVNDNNSLLPFDKVHLDTIPPTFAENEISGIHIGDQVDRSIVKVNIVGATDGVEGSGIDSMIVSNYVNFTNNGSDPQDSVPFALSLNHSLGITLEDVITQLSFVSGVGSKITYFSDTNELYASTSNPATVYKYIWTEEEWKEQYAYGEDEFIDFILRYNDKLIISVGHSTNIAKLYFYNYTYTGNIVESIAFFDILSISESRIFCGYELDGRLYIGSGIGDGDEYISGSGSGGAVYIYDDGVAQNIDGRLLKIVEGIDENIYSLTSISGSLNLLAGTGSSGFIYEIDIENKAAFIVHNNNESIVSMNYIEQGDNGFVFAGGKTKGMIRRSFSNNNSYDISFRTVPSEVSSLKVFSVTDISGNSSNVLYASVGKVIYYLSEYGSWVWRYTHSEDISDMTFDSNNNVLYVISDSGITKVNPLTQSKNIYLKLIDRAGNESEIYEVVNDEAQVKEKFTDSISISDLEGFVNENKIFELDELGNTVFTLKGNSKFYSADKIEEEKGVYTSEVFNGSNELVKWDILSWEATELYNTQVLMYIRSSNSMNDILVADWVGPFSISLSSGVDISSLSGQFLQFKTELISNEKGVTPVFRRANIRTVTSEAIHFFTTNFVMPSRLKKGILTSQKIVPVSADVVFGLNTTNSIDWTEYEEVDENRLFNINQIGENLRVGIKLISPSRSLIQPSVTPEYGPYISELFTNTIDFSVTNNTGSTNNYHFKVLLYSDVSLSNLVYSAYSMDSPEGFNVDGEQVPEDGVSIIDGNSVNVLFAVPGSANLTCNEFYYVKTQYIYDEDFIIVSDEGTFVTSCTASFVDIIDFNFTNNESISNDYHFRIKFYNNLERTSEFLTEFSGNNRSGWFVDNVQIPEDGVSVSPGESVNVVYRPDVNDFDTNKIYYLTIEAHDGSSYVFEENSYTFQLRDVQSTESCGGYFEDVPIVKNFAVMIELEDNEFVTLNL